jgi:hypothetical protein
MKTITCCYKGCGLTFGVPDWWDRSRREDHSWWYCPNGHQQHFSEQSDKERAEAAAKRAQELLESERRRHEATRQERDHQERRARSLKGVVTMTKKRIVKGSCPCCSKSFPDIAAHMAEKHPTYAPATA